MPIHSNVNSRYTIWVENNGRVGYAEAHGAAAARIRNDDDPVAEGHREADRLRHAGQGEAERLYPVRYRTGTSAPRGVEEEAGAEVKNSHIGIANMQNTYYPGTL